MLPRHFPWASAYLLLTLTALFWSANFVVGRGVQGTVPPIALAFWRWTVALCVLLPFALQPMLRERETILRHWKMLVLLGVMGVGSFNTLVYIGLGSTTATNGILLNSAIPAIIVLLGWLFMGQRVSRLQTLGIVVSMAGVAAIIFRGDLSGALQLQVNGGDIWVFAAVVSWAVYTLLLRRRPAGIGSLAFLGTTMAVGWAANLPFFLAELATGARTELNLASVAAIAYTGVFPSVLAYLFWNRAVAEVGPARAGMFVHLMPVFGALLAVVFLGETLHLYHAAGFALILAGIVLATRTPTPDPLD
ncbi:MAG: multidrug transporter [Betaproteobacteria bacterium RIFCSPLOWO2_12_FULL_66_14]|nr:MAG: multidrug transporter [Betaproteobacteria bacterium RIFCSPLOWO2_12_FULL_66_14]